MSKETAYEKRVRAQLDEWQAEIDKLRAKARKAAAESREQDEEQLEELVQLHEDASTHLESMAEASGDEWERLKEGLNERWRKAQAAIEAASDEMTS